MLTGGTYGPVFVNPYNPDHIFVLTSSGVRVSTNGGASFQPDTELTNLITNNGEFPLIGAFPGGAGSAVRIASRAVAFGTLADMAFCRNNLNLVVAGSPFTGVFFRSETGKWRDLTGQLPKPFSPVSSVQIDCDSIYVATEGGGVTRITGFGH
jgi:hypothetical protein